MAIPSADVKPGAGKFPQIGQIEENPVYIINLGE
jgi:hypothetical protein